MSDMGSTPTWVDDPARSGRIGRRAFLAKGALVGAGALAAPLLTRWPEVGAATRVCHIGSTVQPVGGLTQQEALLQLERMVGRRFSTVHNRMHWDMGLVNSYSSWAVQGGRTPILSWFARRPDRSLIGFDAIARGDHDRWITEQARTLRSAGWSGYMCWHKEPEDETDPESWKAAYKRVRKIFANVGVTRFKWVICLIASTFGKGEAGRWIPDARWDMVGADASNRYRCDGFPWKSFDTLFGAARSFARARERKLYVVEFASVEGEPGRKEEWFDDARATIKKWPELVGVSYIHENSDCTYWIDTSQSALEGFRRMMSDTYFKK